jgi:hypothetical protein
VSRARSTIAGAAVYLHIVYEIAVCHIFSFLSYSGRKDSYSFEYMIKCGITIYLYYIRGMCVVSEMCAMGQPKSQLSVIQLVTRCPCCIIAASIIDNLLNISLLAYVSVRRIMRIKKYWISSSLIFSAIWYNGRKNC